LTFFFGRSNHDYGYNVDAQTQYKSPYNNRWVLPARYYTKRLLLGGSQHASLVFLDTSPCISAYRSSDPSGWDPCGSVIPGPPDCQFHQNIIAQNCATQQKWLLATLAAIPAGDWKIAVGHHPADEIDVEDMTTALQQAKFDLYLNGHTHGAGPGKPRG
jgi:hypothetical protein